MKFELLIFWIIFLFYTTMVSAAEVKLAWDPNNETDLAGYRVFLREESWSNTYNEPPVWEAYIEELENPDEPTCTIYSLDENTCYCFVVRAFDIDSNESGNSNEVCINGYYNCDLNTDGRCDIQDLLLLGEDWGRTDCNDPGVAPCECDLNQDGRCDMLDWLYFTNDWGRTD